MKTVETTENGVNFGAAITMTEMGEHLGKLCYTIEGQENILQSDVVIVCT